MFAKRDQAEEKKRQKKEDSERETQASRTR